MSNRQMGRKAVLDIETVPCRQTLWRKLPQDLKEKYYRDDLEEEEAWRNTALDWSLGRIACIGLLLVTDEGEMTKCWCGPDERKLLRRLWKTVRPDDLIIGYNLLDFDLPFIRARCVVNQVEIPWRFDLRRYRQDSVFDIMQVWAHWDRWKSAKLELLAHVLGLERKAGSAEKVYEWYCKKDWKRIENYCLQDVRLTYKIYRRLRRFGLADEEE